MRGARVAGVVVLLAVSLAPGVAHGAEVTRGELRELAQAATDDPAALRELRAVTAVDGQRVDVGGALAGARDEELTARLEALAGLDARPAAAGDPRADARAILAETRFRGGEVPGPFRGLIDKLRDIAPRNLLRRLDDWLPGGANVVWLVLGALLFAAGYVIARLLLSRRIRFSEAAVHALAPADEDPRRLEREAGEAERRGDLEGALRLRFRAGLLRLDRRGAIEFRPSISTLEVRRAVGSPEFDRLAATFDDVVYGGRAAQAADVQEARERWPEVVK